MISTSLDIEASDTASWELGVRPSPLIAVPNVTSRPSEDDCTKRSSCTERNSPPI